MKLISLCAYKNAPMQMYLPKLQVDAFLNLLECTCLKIYKK